jgi:tRNA-2-methylthio-N6-dimethylallyladenosine synthase
MNIISDLNILDDVDAPKLSEIVPKEGARKLYIETYGCQMNVADSEIVASVLQDGGFGLTNNAQDADVVLLNTCAIRENAEQKVRQRLGVLRSIKKKDRPNLVIGVLGCMAERLRHKLLEEEKLVDLVVGPDAYRDLPRLIGERYESGQSAVNVQLSKEETYAEIAPVRYDTNGITAFVSIMRGCNNMCSFCVVPFTRGRERSRNVTSILAECAGLVEQGFKEITVLGQNVNSYRYEQDGNVVSFAELLYRISLISPELRIRYSTSHPKDCSDELLHVHAERHNICNYIHLPVQHGNSEVLRRMRRTYTREQYLDLVDRAYKIVPNLSLSTDIIAGFCGETEEEHLDTLSLIEQVRYDHAYLFIYSERPGTYAARKYTDDIPDAVKKRRLDEIITVHRRMATERNIAEIGTIQTLLVEGTSKRRQDQLFGRTDSNKVVIFDRHEYQAGQYVNVRITDASSATLMGEALGLTTLAEGTGKLVGV